ncbi:MAG: glutamate-1-semialdehyde 2,1-aminomutase [Planctomycetales bacterium]|nr:glutamate-1-semialdehyde 2,1-aminomutase [Planctomycetales bacterium]
MPARSRLEVPRSEALHAEGRGLMPGGVSSPVRAYKAVGGTPLTIVSGSRARVTDADGHSYVDYVGAYGPLILGHAPLAVVEAIRNAAVRGTAYGAPTEGEIRLARLIASALPGVERVRFVVSGTEAAMTAARLARAATSRERIVAFEGGYHGHADSFLAKAGSGMLTLGIPASPGVTTATAGLTTLLPYNDAARLREFGRTRGREVAAVFVEPVAGNMGCIPPEPGFLEALREETSRWGALLVLDEVITGFRLAWGGWQVRAGIRPDLTLLGKVIGGGLPIAAVAGPAALMDRLAPEGPVYQAGTLSGNPIATAAGTATLEALRGAPPYEKLEARGRALAEGLREAAAGAGVEATVVQVGSLLTVFFCPGPVRDLPSASRSDRARFARFFHAMRERGVLLPPSPMECWFLSTAHGDTEIGETIAAAREAFKV